MRTGKSREIIARDSRRTRPVFGQSHICSSPRLSIMISVRSSEEKEILVGLLSIPHVFLAFFYDQIRLLVASIQSIPRVSPALGWLSIMGG